MSLKSLPYKHQCLRQNCSGHTKDYNNYLTALNKTKPKNKISKTARSFNSLHDHKVLKESKTKPPKTKPSKHQISQKSQIEQLKKRNQELQELLQQKAKKINEMKHKIKDYQTKFKHYQTRLIQLQTVINQNQYPKSPISLQKPSQTMMNHYQQQLKLVETSQKATIQAMQKYRLVQKEFHQYRTQTQRKMERLSRENEQLRQFQPQDKTYDQQISSLRKQLHRLSQIQQSPIRHESNTYEQDIITIKTNNKQLMIQKENLSYQLQQKEDCIQSLRSNLENINKKVDKWNEEYKKMVEQRRTIEERYSQLITKYNSKRDKQIKEKEQWASIFRGLMKEVQKLKKELGRLQKSHQKSTNFYSQQND